MYSLVLTSGNAAPGTTGISVRPMISIRRNVCCTSSASQASPRHHGDAQHVNVRGLHDREHRLHVRAAGAGAILIDDDFAFIVGSTTSAARLLSAHRLLTIAMKHRTNKAATRHLRIAIIRVSLDASCTATCGITSFVRTRSV